MQLRISLKSDGSHLLHHKIDPLKFHKKNGKLLLWFRVKKNRPVIGIERPKSASFETKINVSCSKQPVFNSGDKNCHLVFLGSHFNVSGEPFASSTATTRFGRLVTFNKKLL